MAPSAGAAETARSRATRALAVSALLENAERRGYALSDSVQDVIERLTSTLYDYKKNPSEAIAFSRTLKETAVRLFRQRRYRESVARYSLAAQFNPTDPTLTSNRATCMYNMAKYRRCIDLCLDCVTAFPNLSVDNTMLYFKVLLRMGRANIELANFDEARATFDALSNMRNGFNAHFGMQIPEDQFNMLLVPFERHLKAKMEYFEQHGATKGASPIKSANKDTHEDDDDDDDDDDPEGDDENIRGYIQLEDLCSHLLDDGTAPCDHPFPDLPARPAASNRDGDDEYGEPDLATADHSHDDSIPSLISSSHDDDDESADSDMPDLVSEEGDYSATLGDDDDDDDDDEDLSGTEDPSGRSRREALARLRQGARSQPAGPRSLKEISETVSRSAAPLQAKAKGAPVDLIESWEDLKAPTNALNSNNASASSSIKDSIETGFKRGFLADGSLLSQNVSASRQPAPSSSSAEAAGSASRKTHAPVRGCAKVGKRMKSYLQCYDSDEDRGPVTAGLLHERPDEDDAIFLEEKKVKRNETQDWACIGNVLREVMGKSFQTNRTVDFTRIFGHHATASSNSKRKKKSCVKTCGTCFARKMWKMRFVCTDFGEAEAALSSIETDSRREEQTFLSGELWQGTGYYASGYEMAFDVPALVHGVAYMCHLQCELHWRGDKVAFLKDAQHSFVSSLERNYSSHPNKEFLFMIFMLLRDTVNLFGLFPDPTVQGARRSFQFSKSATNIAESALSSNTGEGSEVTSKYQMLLGGKSESLNRNTCNWSRLGQIAKEEEWIYEILLRDVSHLITKITSSVPKTPMYLEEGESFSEAFEKACGERSGDEKYWRCRVVTIVDRERCRLIERTASEAEDVDDTEKSAQLLSNAIACRPQQARLFLRRAQIRAQQNKWKDSLDNIRKGLALVGAPRHTPNQLFKCNPPSVCLKLDLYTLESDVFFERGKEPGQSFVESMKLARQSVEKALACRPKDQTTKRSLQDRLGVAEWYLANVASPPWTVTPPSQNKPEEQRKGSSKTGLLEKDSFKAGGKRKGRTPSRETTGVASASTDAPTAASRGKKRKSRKSQQRVSPKAAPTPIQPENESSSEEEERESSLAGNPYAALLDDGKIPAPPSNRGALPNLGSAPAAAAREHLQDMAAREQSQTGTQGQVSGSGNVHRRRLAASPSATASSSQLECDLCGIQFIGKNDFDSHTKGRRHRTAVANARAAGQTPAEWRARAQPAIPRSRRSGVVIGWQHASSASQSHRSADLNVDGPTREEALAEVERAIAILGGEARPCDIIPRMRFSKWNIRDVNAYLERNFGGLLRLCLQNTRMFEIRPGTESRPVLVWIDPTVGPVRRRIAQPLPDTLRQSIIPPQRQGRSLPRPSHRNNDASASPDLSEMLRNQLRLSSMNRRSDDGRGSGEAAGVTMPQAETATTAEQAECGICYDNVPDIRLIPCRHEWCTPCIAENIERGRNECPVCQQMIQRTEMIYELD